MGKMQTFIRLLKEDKGSIPEVFVANLSKMGLLNWMPDVMYLKLRHRVIFKKKLNLKDPVDFNEKLHWLKLYDRKDEYTMMADKYRVRDYIAERLGEEYLIPLLGVWDRPEDIDFDSLPEQFVIKCNHDSGSVTVCRDRKSFNKEAALAKLRRGMKRNMYHFCREWPYKNIKPCIIAEAFMHDEEQQNGLADYKFYCFNGDPKTLYVSRDMDNHENASIKFMYPDWTAAPFRRKEFKEIAEIPKKPKRFDEMMEIARQLSKDIPFVRVDLYEVNGKIYFSELTFSPGGGLMQITPDEWYDTLGSWIRLPSKTEN